MSEPELRGMPVDTATIFWQRMRQAERERDEARAAARQLFNEPHYGEDDERFTEYLEKWPWLDEKPV